jgi:hypothetical protein
MAMLGSDILETISGIIFLFVLISTLCSAIREGLEAWLKTRAAYLEHGLRELLQDKDGKGILSDLLNHPLLGGLYNGDYTPGAPRGKPGVLSSGRNLPSYIPAQNFAMALMDIAANGPSPQNGGAPASGATQAATPAGGPPSEALTLEKIRANIARIRNKTVQRALLTAVDHANGDLGKAREHLEAWYNSAMDRVSGWYRRSTHWALFFIAIALTVSLNINTLSIADYLYRHTAERGVIVSAAQNASGDQNLAYQTAEKQLADLHLPLGWSLNWEAVAPGSAPAAGPIEQASILPSWILRLLLAPWTDIFQPLIGWLITAFAATLGAPFWFDVLSKVTMIRSTSKPSS